MKKSISRHIIDVRGGFRIATTAIYYSDLTKSRLPIPYPEKPQFATLEFAILALKREKFKVAASDKVTNAYNLSSCQYTFDMF